MQQENVEHLEIKAKIDLKTVFGPTYESLIRAALERCSD